MAMVDHVTNKEIAKDGGFVRQGNRFSPKFGEEPGQLPVEKGRYRLLWAPVCPWANRSLIVRELLGLEDVISVGCLDPIRPDVPWSDWAFTLDEGGVDPVLGIHLLSEAYHKADQDYEGRFTVPALADITTGKVVHNDYHKLTLDLELSFKRFHRKGAPVLYPEELRGEIDQLNQWIFQDVNNGVYRAGFAKSQEAYSKAVWEVFSAFDRLEESLSRQRFLLGDFITEADIRLYVTLARFDVAYYNGFRVNLRMLRDYPNLWGYARDLFSIPAFQNNTHFEAIKKHYHLCCLQTNPWGLLPVGPDVSVWEEPSGRERLSLHPEQIFIEDGEK